MSSRSAVRAMLLSVVASAAAFLALHAHAGASSLASHASFAFAQAQSAKPQGEWKSFRGTVGKYRVQMRLRRDGDALSGSYSYEHVRGGGLRLEGAFEGEGRFTLRE